MKKIISIVLSIAMVLSMVSFTAFAADAQTVADSISADTITTETANLITKNLTLPAEIDGQSITWTSSDESVITNAGVVTRHATEEKAVTLTAAVGDATKEIALTVAPLTTQVIYQNNFARKLDGTEFDLAKELIGSSASTTQVANWKMSTAQTKAPFGTTVGETGGILLDLQTRGNSPTFTSPETLDSPFYVSFDVKTQTKSPGIDFRITFTAEGATASTLQQTLRWNTSNTLVHASQTHNAYGGKNFSTTETTKTRMCVYVDPINLKFKFMDAQGKFVPAAGYKVGGADAKNGVINSMNFCRAGSSSPAGTIEIDNFAVYRLAPETQIYNDRVMLRTLAGNVTLADFSTEDASAVTSNLDLATFKNKIESENEGVTVSYASSNEEVLAIDGTTGVITRPFDDTAVKLEVVVAKGDSKFGKTIEFTVKEAFNPAKQAANEIYFDMFTDEANLAVTKDLDLSIREFYASSEAEGAVVSFTSNDASVLKVEGAVGYITPADEKKDVTLTATVEKGGRTFTKDFNITVLPEGSYVFESENFGYPALLGKSIGALQRWTITNNYSRATYADIAKNNNGYYLETARTKKAGGYDDESYNFTSMRRVDKATLEFDFSVDSIISGVTHDIHIMGVKKGGKTISDVTKNLLKIRVTNGSFNLSASKSVDKAIAEGKTYRVKFVFDFENQTFDYYFDNKLASAGLTWASAGNFEYEALSYINFRSYRESANFKFGIDNFALYSENPQYSNSDIDDEANANRPMTVSFSQYTSGGAVYYQSAVTTRYDEKQNLRQNFIEKPETFTNNPIIDFNGADLVNRETGKSTALIGYVSTDETNPQLINGLYIGSNHGAMGARVTSNAHGKTQADVGSVWKDANGVKWDLIRVEDANKLYFVQQKNYNLATDSFGFSGSIVGPLTYVSDGVNTSQIAIGSYTATQTFPSIANVEHSFYLVRDGVKIPVDNKESVGVAYKCDEYVIIEEYDIINPGSIAASLRENRPEGGYTTAPTIATGEPIFHYKQILTIKADGTVFTEIDHDVLTDLKSYDTYGYQFYPRNNIYGGGVWRQVPGTKEFSDSKGVKWDISDPYEYTIVSGTPGTDLTVPLSRTLNSKDWVDANIVPSRILDYYRDSNGKNVMGYMTGFLPIYMGEPAVRKTLTNTNIYMYDYKVKAYPIFVQSGGASNKAALTSEGSNIHGVSYRKYVDLKGFDENQTQYYSIDHEGMTYYYVDFAAAGEQVIDLSTRGCLYDLTQVEVLGDITYKQSGDTIVVTSAGKGYLVLKAARALEIENASVTDGKAFVRFVNYSDSAKSVDVAIACYDGNRLTDIKVSKNEVIGANAVLNTEFKVANTGKTYKVFVLDANNSIVPVGREMTATVK